MDTELRSKIEVCYTAIEERQEEIAKLELEIEAINEVNKKIQAYELYFDELQKKRKEKLYSNLNGLDSLKKYSNNILQGVNDFILDNISGTDYHKACNNISESITIVNDEVEQKQDNIDYLKEEIYNLRNEISYYEQELENYG